MARVFSKTNAPEDAVYIGRGSPHGNLFVIGRDGNRNQVIYLHKMDIARRPEYLDSLDALIGKNLMCYCAPRACHGDILLKLTNLTRPERRMWASRFLIENGG